MLIYIIHTKAYNVNQYNAVMRFANIYRMKQSHCTTVLLYMRYYNIDDNLCEYIQMTIWLMSLLLISKMNCDMIMNYLFRYVFVIPTSIKWPNTYINAGIRNVLSLSPTNEFILLIANYKTCVLVYGPRRWAQEMKLNQ